MCKMIIIYTEIITFCWLLLETTRISVCLDAGSTPNAKNFALFKHTFQSTDSDNSTISDLAVDNNITTCSVTERQKGAYWTVVLDDIVPISRIKMNLGGAFFGPSIEIYVKNILNDELGLLCQFGSSEATSDVIFSCYSGPVLAKIVTVRNKFSGSVQLCDFQVLVCNDGFFGVECTKCKCDGDVLCEKTNGRCPELCAPGFNGTDCQSVCADGLFGPSCRQTCHCSSGATCDKQTGDCPAGCDDNWVGPVCQTEIPQLMTPATMYRADVTEITIIWHSWIRYVDPSITLLYKIEYKLSSDIHGDQMWIEGPLQADTDHFNENKTITELQRNSFYIVRVLPVLRVSSTELIDGGASPESIPFRTKCLAPETPNITNSYSWMDASRHTPVAVLSIEWTPLTQKQSNCENILYYEIFYQKRGSDWRSVGAKKTEHAKNISSDVSFESEYLVRVVAHNNHPYQASSDTRIIVTPRAHIYECQSGASTCNPSSEDCFNNSGSYRCECKIGFVNMSGKCEEINKTNTLAITFGTLLVISLLINALFVVFRIKSSNSTPEPREARAQSGFEPRSVEISDQIEIAYDEIPAGIGQDSVYEQMILQTRPIVLTPNSEYAELKHDDYLNIESSI